MHFLIKWKKTPRLLLTFGMLFCFISVLILQNYSLIKQNQRIFEKENLDSPTLRISDYGNNIYFIHINNDNWSSTDVDWIQNRTGTWDDPHIIENITVNGGGSGSCITIENSNEFFIIRNCTVYNSGPIYNEATLQFDAGIKLVNITNGKILNNSCSDTTMGIALLDSNNITISNNTVDYNEYGIGFLNSNNTIISRNTVNYNEFTGIHLASSENCNISENNVNENREGIYIPVSNKIIVLGNSINNNYANGINLVLSNNNNITNNVVNNNFVGVTINGGYNNTLSGNNMTECGVVLLGGYQEEFTSHILDDTNLVNGNPLFCFINEIGLGKNNFTNPGQIILINCSDSLISGFNISHATMGISLYYCVNNSIYNNNLSFCDTAGIGMWFSSNHVISGNSIERSGFFITGTPDSFYSNNFTSNMVNGKDFYYYVNETGLGKDNFTNPGQIFLINCNDSIVSNLNVSYATIGVGVLGKNITISNITASHNLIGVLMGNSYDCIISDNILSDNKWCGMYLDGNWNITIKNNTINENDIGIDFLFNCQYNNITENTINNNGRGIQTEGWAGNFDNNNISRNTINNNDREGILLQNSNNNTLLENTLNNNKDGLCLKYSNNNTISGNYIQNNVKNGIYFYNCNNNTISGNNINNNVLQGILLEENCFSNFFHVNYFIKNGIHVIDNLLNNNYWNSSVVGNFWDDYTGKDADNDGIGDTPHCFMDGVDYLPIWESLAPTIIINLPSDDATFGSTSPNFEVIIKDETIILLKDIVHVDTMWYTLDGGETNYTFITNGTINQAAWDVLLEGLVTLGFHANDTLGNLGTSVVTVIKSILSIPATIHFDPDTLNLKNNVNWVTVYIELPTGFDVNDIEISSILLNEQVSAEENLFEVGDYDNDGILDLMVKLPGADVQSILEPGENVEIVITGLVNDLLFEGRDYIRVISKGKKNDSYLLFLFGTYELIPLSFNTILAICALISLIIIFKRKNLKF